MTARSYLDTSVYFSLRILLFLLPTQLGIHFWPDYSFIFGIRVDYFSPTIYITDILLVTFVFFGVLKIDFKRYLLKRIFYPTLCLVLLFVTLNILNSSSSLITLYKWIKVFEYSLFVLVLSNIKLEVKKDVCIPLILSLVFITLLGIVQFVSKSYLGGPFYFFGERAIDLSTIGASKTTLFGHEYLRSYSTFSHPNSFAGYLLVSSFLLLFLSTSKVNIFKIILAFVIFIAIALTFSLGALIALLVGLLLILFKSKRMNTFVFITLCVAGLLASLYKGGVSQSFGKDVYERVLLNNVAGTLISKSFLVGVGLGNFIESYVVQGFWPYVNWLLQPVHNIFLLLLSEVGLLGLLTFCYITLKSISRSNWRFGVCIVLICVAGIFDHYWLTLQQNQLLLALVIGLSFNPILRKE